MHFEALVEGGTKKRFLGIRHIRERSRYSGVEVTASLVENSLLGYHKKCLSSCSKDCLSTAFTECVTRRLKPIVQERNISHSEASIVLEQK